MKHAFPAALIGLTALITSALVHAGYAIGWLSQFLFRAHPLSYDWAAALALSGTATTMVLIAALVVRRLAAGNTRQTNETAPEALPARVARH